MGRKLFQSTQRTYFSNIMTWWHSNSNRQLYLSTLLCFTFSFPCEYYGKFLNFFLQWMVKRKFHREYKNVCKFSLNINFLVWNSFFLKKEISAERLIKIFLLNQYTWYVFSNMNTFICILFLPMGNKPSHFYLIFFQCFIIFVFCFLKRGTNSKKWRWGRSHPMIPLHVHTHIKSFLSDINGSYVKYA